MIAATSSATYSGTTLGTGADRYTVRIDQYVQIFANGSKASLDDQLKAYQSLQALVSVQDADGYGDVYNTNKADSAKATAALDPRTNDLSARINAAGNKFTDGLRGALAQGQNEGEAQWTALSKLSPDEQKLAFVSLKINVHGSSVYNLPDGRTADTNYDTIDEWKSAIQQEADFLKQNPDGIFVRPGVTYIPPKSAEADGAGGQGTAAKTLSAAKTSSKAIVDSLPKGSAKVSTATVALQVLLKGQEDAQTSRHDANTAVQSTSGSSAHNASPASSANQRSGGKVDTTA